MRTTTTLVTASLLAVAGCATPGVSYELRTARDTLHRAKSGLAAHYEPDQVRRAENTLHRAEQAPLGSTEERDSAYIADRQARIAMAEATTRLTRQALAREERDYRRELERATIERERELRSQRSEAERLRGQLAGVHTELGEVRDELDRRGQALDEQTQELARRERELAAREQQLLAALRQQSEAESELGEARNELAQVRRELGSVRGELNQRGQQLDQRTQQLTRQEQELAVREQQLQDAIAAREEAEQRARQAMEAVARTASVREENGVTIVTLSGEVLFEYDQADLRPMARQRLRSVANALKAQPGTTIVIEGHTDDHGSEQYNHDLSARRAEAVRRFLIEEGVAGSRIRAEGLGESQPVATNATPEGRANNRRVEIVIRPQEEQRVSALGPGEHG